MAEYALLGKRIPKPDAINRVTGRMVYADDMTLPGVLAGKILGSPVAHGRIRRLDVSKAADVRDTGLPVYPGARLKERNKDKNKDEGDDDDSNNNASVNISSSLFGLRVVALEYLSEDSPEKLIAYYTDKLRRYGNVIECHTNKSHAGATIDSSDDSKGPQQLKCESDDRNGKIVELKAGTRQSQHIVSIKPADAGKGSDFGLVFVQVRGGKDTI